MKQLNYFILVALFTLGAVNIANAQDRTNPWAFSFGVNAVDFHPVGENPKGIFSDYPSGELFDNYFNAEDHYNMVPIISRLSVSRYVGDGFVISVAGSFNKIKKVSSEELTTSLNYYGADAELKYGFGRLMENNWLDPYLGIGGGYTWIDNEGFATANALAGFNFWLTDNIGLNLQSAYKHSFETNSGARHFQHAAGVTFKFGGDVIKEPEIIYVEEPVYVEPKDDCAELEAEVKKLKEKVKRLEGELEDLKIENRKLLAEKAAENMVKELNAYSKTVLFEVSKANIRRESLKALQDIAEAMKEYPDTHFVIEGHTDITGSKAFNQKLSEERAASVKEYLIEIGMDKNRLSSIGYGPDRPIADNNTNAGREENRRVQISLKDM